MTYHMDLSLANINSEEQPPNETTCNPHTSTNDNDKDDRESFYMEINPEEREHDDEKTKLPTNLPNSTV